MLNWIITKKATQQPPQTPPSHHAVKQNSPAARNTDKFYLLFRIKYPFTASGAYWTRRLFQRNIAEL